MWRRVGRKDTQRYETMRVSDTWCPWWDPQCHYSPDVTLVFTGPRNGTEYVYLSEGSVERLFKDIVEYLHRRHARNIYREMTIAKDYAKHPEIPLGA